MLKKINIIRLKKEFEEIRTRGEIHQSPIFGLVTLDIRSEGESRFGFVISKKISKKAVVRNKIRRLLAESVRVNLKNIKKGYLVLFLVKKEIIGMKFGEVETEVKRMFERMGIKKQEKRLGVEG
ncbi:ribonuclease P protein component [Patescibacteria group bacterium]|nr:ribonuclease P protein component [Patescibacteria group bacterium]MCG2701703.1 ribonuclease P protein component [Candidatus Parcubacteria bacterium]MBU4265362.1 ribonuclease P protein component [Patescibacteria group bacterium]MBU4390314.1 ribonuclease P protein component [Patescibacteria group bacterium]MBU4396561.1 ribonuclease P protein component [Patescibacteria group bacterium]